jgi:hypothetical protein
MRLIIHAIHPSGFPIDIEIEPGEQEKVDAIVERLCRQGYRAPMSTWPTGPDGAPLCFKHGGIPMSKREKQGDSWFSHRVITASGEERYCRGYATGRADDGFACEPSAG